MRAPIAILLHADRRGGAERAMRSLAATLAGRGLAVDLVLMSGSGGAHEPPPPGVRPVVLGARRVATSVRPLARYLADERPSAALSALTHANIATILARRLSGARTRLVVVEHCLLSRLGYAAENRRDRLWPRAAATLYRHADAVACVSEGLADDTARVTGIPRAEIAVVRNPVSHVELRQAAGGPPPHPWLETGQPPVVLGVGRLEPVKSFHTLIDALALLRDRVPARLIVLGEGGERRRLQAQVRRLGLQAAVDMPGFERNPYPFIARAAAVALSSVREGLPTIIVEALALSRPVVASDCQTGPREILDGGRLGRLVPPGDAPAMAEALADAIVTPGPPVHAAAVEAYEPDLVADRYLALLHPREVAAAGVG